jgi:diguanylate cyclase (GGDEF)-like protein
MTYSSTRTIGWVAGLLAVVIGLLPPVGYFSLSYLREKGEMLAEAELIAQMATQQVVSRDKDGWDGQIQRLEALIRRDFIPTDLPEQRRVLNLDGKVVAVNPPSLSPPVLAVPAMLRHADRAVGRVEIRRSLLPLIWRTGGVAVLGLALALAVYLAPLRAVRDAYARLEHQATHDALTGVPNRKLIDDRLLQAIAQSRRSSTILAVAFVDLDNFKVINDKLGHSVGDALLQAVAARLRATLREGDTVGRQGGDEFVLILPGNRDEDAVAGVMQRIIKAIAEPLKVDKHDLRVTCSIGVSLFPEDGDGADVLLRRADAAMYLAKGQGRNRYQFFAADINHRMEARRVLQRELAQALERGEFELYFQPQVDLTSRGICGVEALLRWRHPRRGLLAPADFLPAAQEPRLIRAIDVWVTRTVCAQQKRWQSAGLPPVRVAVNGSERIQDAQLVPLVEAALRDSGLAPSWLEFAFKESVLLGNPSGVCAVLRELRALGIQLCVDKFGVAPSSVSRLKRLPLDRLKVDPSLVRRIGRRGSDEGALEGVVSLGHALGLKVLAQEVETAEQLAFLQSRGYDEVQGNFLYPVMSADVLAGLLRRRSGVAVQG